MIENLEAACPPSFRGFGEWPAQRRAGYTDVFLSMDAGNKGAVDLPGLCSWRSKRHILRFEYARWRWPVKPASIYPKKKCSGVYWTIFEPSSRTIQRGSNGSGYPLGYPLEGTPAVLIRPDRATRYAIFEPHATPDYLRFVLPPGVPSGSTRLGYRPLLLRPSRADNGWGWVKS